MKRICCIFLLLVFGCTSHYYYSETNHKGIAERKFRKSIFRKRDGGYASDGIYVKNVIFSLGDTIAKRCFTSEDLECIKNLFLSDSLLNGLSFSLRPYSTEDLIECNGLYIIRFIEPNSDYIEYPLLKINGRISVNMKTRDALTDDFGLEARKYVERELSTVYDLEAIEKRLDIFLNGKSRILFSDHHLPR